MKPTNINDPEYFHKVVDCQYACPAHTPVPEYIRLIADEKYTEAYMINWESNVFPGILGRTCDRPCEPACRRGRVEEKPVAICRLKRVAADNKGDVKKFMPKGPFKPNGKKVALIGGGPASLTVARDLAPLGYEIHLFDEWHKGGGMMRTQIPAFRLPEEVLDEEVNYVLDLGVHTHFNHFVHSMKDEILSKDYDAVFVGTGAPSGRKLNLPGFEAASDNIHIGIEFLASVAFEHKKSIGKKVIVLGGGNTAMDCCRTSRRIGGEDVKVIVRSPFKDMKASPWEIEDAQMEDIPIMNNMPPKEFVVENGKLKGVIFGRVYADYSSGRRKLHPTGEPDVFIEADDVIIAIGQDNAFPWIERDLGIEFGKWDIPVLGKTTFQSTLPKVFFGGDAAFGPENVITAAAHGHQAAVSIHLFCEGDNLVADRPDPMNNVIVGGGMAYTFMKAQGGKIGNSLVENDRLELALELIAKAKERKVKLLLPKDSIAADDFSNDANIATKYTKRIPKGWMGLDIGPKAIADFQKVIAKSKTILWNGPMGVFEMSNFSTGTKSIAQACADATANGAFSLVGGGDSVAAVTQMGLNDDVSFVSTGGGAMLEFLEGKELPAIAAMTK